MGNGPDFPGPGGWDARPFRPSPRFARNRPGGRSPVPVPSLLKSGTSLRLYSQRVGSRRSHPSSPVSAAAGQILAPKKQKNTKNAHKIKIKSKLNQN
jgi:hypothetical protein